MGQHIDLSCVCVLFLSVNCASSFVGMQYAHFFARERVKQ